MRIYTKTELHWDETSRQYNVVPIEWFEYSGPVAKLDRAAQGQAKDAATTAGDVASTEQSSANAEKAKLRPFFEQEMDAQHAFNPQQLNELMNFQEQGAGGAGATIEGEAKSQDARTRNESGFSAALDEAARDKQKALSSGALGVGMEDVKGAKALNQAGAAGEAGLYGDDTKAMLDAMGIQTGDIKTQIEAGKSGWFQNMTDFMKSVGEMAGGIGKAASGFSGGK